MTFNDKDLDELIKKINMLQNKRALSDEFLIENNCRTRKEIGIGEYNYGVIMIPVDFVLPYLLELQDIKKAIW